MSLRNPQEKSLKILEDIQCFVYCDFEPVGEAISDSIFRLHILCNNNEDNSLL